MPMPELHTQRLPYPAFAAFSFSDASPKQNLPPRQKLKHLTKQSNKIHYKCLESLSKISICRPDTKLWSVKSEDEGLFQLMT